MDAPDGHAAPQDPGDLPPLSRGHPCWTGHQADPTVITGERGAGKLARPAREQADGKGPHPRAPRQAAEFTRGQAERKRTSTALAPRRSAEPTPDRPRAPSRPLPPPAP